MQTIRQLKLIFQVRYIFICLKFRFFTLRKRLQPGSPLGHLKADLRTFLLLNLKLSPASRPFSRLLSFVFSSVCRFYLLMNIDTCHLVCISGEREQMYSRRVRSCVSNSASQDFVRHLIPFFPFPNRFDCACHRLRHT